MATYWGTPRQQLRTSAVGRGEALKSFKLERGSTVFAFERDSLAALQKVGLHLLAVDPCPSQLCRLLSSASFHLFLSPSVMSRSKAVPCSMAWDCCAVFFAGRLVNKTDFVELVPHRLHRELGQGLN